ncbi:Type IV secretory system Conjugative DNA transfer [Jatrophihabitans endophyticus]|uniref:Type IV secretory system Conjugative DNA transfer n=1 Tax=Jatrophihabitans endophyticus TaxID=1206085 RepID=A0A1M5RYD7_9ACTN|nr:type IV secretory system conjugative DNA transfer family protein [Jatrophihabitans endophyticus]SHH31256.1 Type IV secretory system Conjugative DNA transfer [Jatrophihabitans endophyticus]
MPESRTTWRELRWQRPLEVDRVAGALRQWAADARSPRIVLELRLTRDGARYLIGWPSAADIRAALATIPNATLVPVPDELRTAVVTSGQLKANTRHRPLVTDHPERVVRALLATGVRLVKGEQLVVQLLLGPRRIPLAVPDQSPSSVVAPWYTVAWIGNGGRIDGDKRRALRSKVSDFGFACAVRLGVTATDAERRKSLLLGLSAAVRVAEAPGVQLRFRRMHAHDFNAAVSPLRWPLRLGVPELVGLTGWPLGDEELPGLPSPHPKPLSPAPGTTGTELVIADATATDKPTGLVLPMSSAVRHVHVIAPTGAGKSTLLANWTAQVVNAGHGAVVIEPKGDLVDDVLARIKPEHQERVVVLDPNDPAPVGLNPLATQGGRSPELVADAMVSVFKQLYGKAVGARTQDILYAGLLTLARRGDASLVMLPLLFTNPGFRRSVTAGLRDPLVLEPFWATFEHWSDAERMAAVAPAMNKLRPLLRPGLRGVLGQRAPRFTTSQIFTERKVLLVPLKRGVIGPDAAQLLGSLVVADLWQSIQARANVPAADRHPVAIVIDEVQDYLHLPTDLADGLAQARGYGAGFVLSHQFLSQLPRELKSAVLANALSRIVFRLPHEDAVQLAKGHPELAAADLEALGPYEVYANLFARGTTTPYASGRSRPLGSATADVAAVRSRSRAAYGRPLDEVEAGFSELYDQTSAPDDLGPTGRRRRSP